MTWTFCKPHRRTPSLPSRERGLKFVFASQIARAATSLPSRERGLKFISERLIKCIMSSFAEQWIEIGLYVAGLVFGASLPSRERGLKSDNPEDVAYLSGRPFAGAWIEITCLLKPLPNLPSLPSRERGLKFPGCSRGTRAERRSLRGSVD